MLTSPHQRLINSNYYKYSHPSLRSHQLHRTITDPHNLQDYNTLPDGRAYLQPIYNQSKYDIAYLPIH